MSAADVERWLKGTAAEALELYGGPVRLSPFIHRRLESAEDWHAVRPKTAQLAVEMGRLQPQ
jgi:hypothetical protein